MIANIQIDDEIKFNEIVNKVVDIKSLIEVVNSININFNYLRVFFIILFILYI